ncbi:MAG TPA: adenylate/guanylate cyclase domain-containing protein, partial [Myxococcota bacterium]|nr:adenylate/guanylate cyclase domain-containing protein [Myxococcota bacterium]
PALEVIAAAAAWARRLAEHPEGGRVLDASRRAHYALRKGLEAATAAGLTADDVYLTVDPGLQSEGPFRDGLALAIGALPWWDDPIHPGVIYDLAETDGAFWRASYLPELGGAPGGFAHNPTHDPILPRFEEDTWGTWFSVWRSEQPAEGLYVTTTMDIEAASVKALMRRATALTLASASLLAALVVMVSSQLASRVSRPVARLRRGAEAVLEMNYDYRVRPDGPAELVDLIDTFNRMTGMLHERANLLGTLERLLSKELAQDAAERGLSLGGTEQTCTVMFTDFAGFTTLTHQMPAAEIVHALNAYFQELVPIIRHHGGFPDKYIGDAMVAIFGAPLAFPDHADRAVACAIELQRRLRAINAARRERGEVVFEMRVGLNTGEVVVGAIGCDTKLEFTSIGESTNVANRLESACPIGHVMVAADTLAAMRRSSPADVGADLPAEVYVKGYTEPIRACTLWIDDLRVTRGPDGRYVYAWRGA